MTTLLSSWIKARRGTATAEFALVLTPFLLLLFGVIHLSLLSYAAMQLNWAAEATARCMVVAQNSGYASASCATNATATSYFDALYHGPTGTPTLTTLDETQICDSAANYQVVATTNYVINAVFFNKTVALTAKACFPHT